MVRRLRKRARWIQQRVRRSRSAASRRARRPRLFACGRDISRFVSTAHPRTKHSLTKVIHRVNAYLSREIRCSSLRSKLLKGANSNRVFCLDASRADLRARATNGGGRTRRRRRCAASPRLSQRLDQLRSMCGLAEEFDVLVGSFATIKKRYRYAGTFTSAYFSWGGSGLSRRCAGDAVPNGNRFRTIEKPFG